MNVNLSGHYYHVASARTAPTTKQPESRLY